MRPGAIWAMAAALVSGALAACGPPAAPREPDPNAGTANGAQFADDSRAHPSYSRAALESTLIAERGAEASATAALADLDAGSDSLRAAIAHADAAVRARFIASLERCQSQALDCPPRLDDPPLPPEFDPAAPPPKSPFDTPLRFDLDTWRKLAAELHGRACACRSLACLDRLDASIDLVDRRPMPAVQDDDDASAAIVAARECLFRLRGKHVAPSGTNAEVAR